MRGSLALTPFIISGDIYSVSWTWMVLSVVIGGFFVRTLVCLGSY